MDIHYPSVSTIRVRYRSTVLVKVTFKTYATEKGFTSTNSESAVITNETFETNVSVLTLCLLYCRVCLNLTIY